MKIRAYSPDDLDTVMRLHEKFHSHLELPKFDKMLLSFVIEDDKGTITLGGLKPIAEIMLLTDLDRSARKRVEALHEAKIASLFTCLKFKIDEAIAFTTDEVYKDQLVRNGFNPLGEGLGLKVHNG